MDDQRAPRRFFSEKEVGQVLRHATELQEAAKTTDPTGLTFEEVQQIAAEAGIDPRYLATAVAALDREEDTDERFHWLGAPMRLNIERVVEGEVSDEQWEEMVGVIRSSFNLVGASGRVGRSREWTHDSKEQQAQVTVTSRNGQTKLRIYARYPQLAAVVFLPALNLSIIPIVAILTDLALWAGIPLALAFLGVLVVGLRFLFSRLMRRRERKARDLLDKLEQTIAASAEAMPQPEAAQEGRVDASLLAEEAPPEETAAPTGTRTRSPS